jgi:hypothetical protein
VSRADLLAAKKKGHIHAVAIDRGAGERKLVSTHRSYEEACKALRASKGNTVWKIEDLLK